MKLSKRLRKWKANITVQIPIDYMLMLRDDIDGFADEVKALEAENKELKVLVKNMQTCINHVAETAVNWDCTDCPLDGTRECDFEGRMITMGIEVE